MVPSRHEELAQVASNETCTASDQHLRHSRRLRAQRPAGMPATASWWERTLFFSTRGFALGFGWPFISTIPAEH
jgi:hypothetical protein